MPHIFRSTCFDSPPLFLHKQMTEMNYNDIHIGFSDKNKPHEVCLLHKALYGFKQAPILKLDILIYTCF